MVKKVAVKKAPPVVKKAVKKSKKAESFLWPNLSPSEFQGLTSFSSDETPLVKKPVKKAAIKKALTKKAKKAAIDEVSLISKQIQGTDPHTLSVVDEVYNALKNVRTEFVFSEVFHRISCPTFHIEAMFDKFWRDYTLRYGVPALELIYAKLKDLNKVSFNDLDDEMFIIPDPKGEDRRILIHKSQNLRLLFVWDKSLSKNSEGFGEGFGDIHVRRFYDRYESKGYDPLGELNTAEDKIQFAIRHSEELSVYADDLDNLYPQRYSLDHYLKNDFQMQYGDARDKGFIISCKGFFPSLTAGGTLAQNGLLKIVWDCYIPCMLSELYDCSAYDSLSNQFKSKGGLISKNKEEDEEELE